VPRVLHLGAADGPLGVDFYVMERVVGHVCRNALPPGYADGPEPRAAIGAALVDVLADLHAVDPQDVGLAGFGKPAGFMARQVRRWGMQLDNSRSREIEGVDDLRQRLGASVPESSGAAIVHGDYRLDNLIVAGPGEPDALSVRAVLDWEMATLGDPLADLGLLMAYWDVLSTLPNEVARSMGEDAGFPSGATLTGWYAERRGGADLSALPWYVAFGLFKLAVIIEGIHYRFTLGQTVGEGYERIGDIVPLLVGAGRERLDAM